MSSGSFSSGSSPPSLYSSLGFQVAGGILLFVVLASISVAIYVGWRPLQSEPQYCVKQFGSSGEDWVRDAVAGSEGRLYAVGYTSAALPGETHQGDYDAFVMRLDTSQSRPRFTQFGTPGPDRTHAITRGPERLWVLGTTADKTRRIESDLKAFVIRSAANDPSASVMTGLSPREQLLAEGIAGRDFGRPWIATQPHDGDSLRRHNLGDRLATRPRLELTDIAALPTGDLIVVGHENRDSETEDDYRELDSEKDALIARVSSDGAVRWMKFVRTLRDDQFNSVSILPNGTAVIGGTTDGGLLSQEKLTKGKVSIQQAKRAPMAATHRAHERGELALAAMYRPDGERVWAQTMSSISTVRDLHAGPAGDTVAIASDTLSVRMTAPDGRLTDTISVGGDRVIQTSRGDVWIASASWSEHMLTDELNVDHYARWSSATEGYRFRWGGKDTGYGVTRFDSQGTPQQAVLLRTGLVQRIGALAQIGGHRTVALGLTEETFLSNQSVEGRSDLLLVSEEECLF